MPTITGDVVKTKDVVKLTVNVSAEDVRFLKGTAGELRATPAQVLRQVIAFSAFCLREVMNGGTLYIQKNEAFHEVIFQPWDALKVHRETRRRSWAKD